MLFIEAPESIEEMRIIGERFDKPLVANIVDGGKTPVLGVDELRELGYRLAIFPATGFLAMGAALDAVYRHIHQQGSSQGVATPLYDFNAFSELMGFPAVWEFERRWAEPD